MLKYILYLLLITSVLSSCMDDDSLWNIEKPGYQDLSSGVFIVNEGNMMYENASLSYYNIETKEIFNSVFFNTNALPLGDVAHSITSHNDLGYVIINNSGRVYVFNVNTFEYVGKITGLTSPRYFHFINDSKAYITDLYAQSIAIINPQTLELKGNIDVSNPESNFYQHPTEQMVQYDTYVFINCWSFDNKILIIDTQTDQWVDEIEVLIQPNSMVLDKNDKLWVLSDGGFEGNPFGHEAPGLIRIDAKSREIEKIFRFELNDYPRSLTINGNKDTLYFINRHVWRHAVYDDAQPEVFISSPYTQNYSAGFYGLGIDPLSSEIYIADAIDFVQLGLVYRYSPRAIPIDTLKAGIIPRSFLFN